MPRGKAQKPLLGLIESESEEDLGLEYHVAKPHNTGPSKKTMPPKKAAARGRGPANKVTKPGHATNRSGPRSAAATDTKNAGRQSGPGRGRSTKVTTATEIADCQAPVDEPAQLIKTKPGRGRRKAAAPEEDDGGGLDPLSDPIADLEPEPLEPVRGRRGRMKKKQSAVDPTAAIPETQAPPDPMVISTHDETDRMEDTPPPSVSTAGPTSILRQANASFSVSRPPPPTREHGTAMAEPSLRRRLGELTHKYDSLEQKYRDLREIGVKEAELNFDKLKKQSDERANTANRLVASLKAELATQTAMAKEGLMLRDKLEASEAMAESLQENAVSMAASLEQAQADIKMLNTKLAASRTTEAAATAANSRYHGNAMKNGISATRQANTKDVVGQAKTELYCDLTGLIITGMKKDGGEDLFDCIQTGRNGTLHFKLAVANENSSEAYEDSEFRYQPQLDENRDRAMIEMLPEYLSEEITFPRPQASKFYARVMKALTEKLG